MKTKSANICLVLMVSTVLATPAYARGFGGGHFGGGFGGGRGFGGFGGHDFGGFGGHGFGGHDFGSGGFSHFDGGASRMGGFGGHENHANFGGGFNNASGVRSGFNSSGFHGESGGFNSWQGHGAVDGGFGKISGMQNRTPQQFDNRTLNNQGNGIRNSFNNDSFSKNTTNNFNRTATNNFNQYNHYGNNYGGYHGYGYGGYGYHPYGAYGYHPYGYGGWGYPGGWYAPGWSTATAWTCASMATLGSFLGIAALASSSGGHSNNNGSSQPASYSNVTYNNDTVYVNGQPSGTPQQFYSQAQQLAGTGLTAQTQLLAPSGFSPSTENATVSSDTTASAAEQWQPLGVFALAQPGETQSNMMLQLAINKDGIVRGNYFNQLTNESSEVYGALDKNTQRVSWTIGTNPNTVFDAGLGDLVNNDSSVLVHYSPTDTQRMALIRLPQPQNGNDVTNTDGMPPVVAPTPGA